MKPVPSAFDSQQHYASAFEHHLLEEVRAGVQQALQQAGSAAAYLVQEVSIRQVSPDGSERLWLLCLTTAVTGELAVCIAAGQGASAALLLLARVPVRHYCCWPRCQCVTAPQERGLAAC
jgi:hypothetical protein